VLECGSFQVLPERGIRLRGHRSNA
jgi:hypothetical protein